jgi:hypothetical protein
MGQTCLRASLIACVIALAATVSSVHAATPPCPDPGAICNIQCYNSPVLHCLARMLGHRKRHRGLQSRSLRSGATLPRTPLIDSFPS